MSREYDELEASAVKLSNEYDELKAAVLELTKFITAAVADGQLDIAGRSKAIVEFERRFGIVRKLVGVNMAWALHTETGEVVHRSSDLPPTKLRH